MATVSYIQEHTQSPAAMKTVINYCCQDQKVYDELSGRRLISGINCDGENAYKEFMLTKNAYHKANGTFFYQYTQSFSPAEDITPEQAHEIALEFAEKAWKGHEVMVTTHCDKAHIHSHFIINSVSFENGYKLRQDPSTLKELRQLSDEICKKNNLSVLEPYEKSGMKMSTKEYRAAVRGESWKFKLMADIETAMEYSGSKREFIDNMSTLGYSVTWTPERKYLTFLCPNGKRCRDFRLHEEKFLKENIENELRIRESKYSGLAETEEQEFAWRNRSVAGRNENNFNTDSGQGIGNGTSSDSGGLSTGAVREDRRDTNARGDGQVYGRDAEHRYELLSENGGHISEGTDITQSGDSFGNETDGGKSSGDTVSDAGEYRTGWEESRELYEQHLAERQKAGTGYSGSGEEGWAAQRAEMDNDFNPLIGSLDSLASSVSKIIDDSSADEEERRKRIEAEENANAIGTVLGTAIGIIGNALHSDTAKGEHKSEHHYQEPDQNNNEYEDYDEPEDEDYGFSL